MPPLSSCYFCGAALDDRLRAYGFERGPDGGRSVVLCPGCRRKLDRVFEAAGDSTTLVALEEPSGPDDRPDAPGDGADSTAGRDGLVSLSGADASDTDERDDTEDTGRASDASDADGGTESPEGGDPEATRTDRTDADRTDARDSTDGDGKDAADADATPDTDERSDTAGGADAPPSHSVSPSTYDQVLRLLRNREFPVERAEIETVAASAYDLSEREVRAVLDLAIERGAVEADGGRLRRPD